jgi:hypothetical protein
MCQKDTDFPKVSCIVKRILYIYYRYTTKARLQMT